MVADLLSFPLPTAVQLQEGLLLEPQDSTWYNSLVGQADSAGKGETLLWQCGVIVGNCLEPVLLGKGKYLN